jgi:hypothetical protein
MAAGAYMIRTVLEVPDNFSHLQLIVQAPYHQPRNLRTKVLDRFPGVGILVQPFDSADVVEELAELVCRPEVLNAIECEAEHPPWPQADLELPWQTEPDTEVVPRPIPQADLPVGQRCVALYTSYRRFMGDLESMEAGAFFAPLRRGHPALMSPVILRIHMPDGVRYEMCGEVIQTMVDRGVTIGLEPEDPNLVSMRMATKRAGFITALATESEAASAPQVRFTDLTDTLPTQSNAAQRQEVAAALNLVRATSARGGV